MKENTITALIKSKNVANTKKRNPNSLSNRTYKQPWDPFCLGSLLLNGQFIDADQLDSSLEIHRKKNLLQGECLLKMGAIDRDVLSTVLTFQEKIRELSPKIQVNKRLKIGQLLTATEMITSRELQRAIKIQKRSKKLLGEILVDIGAITKKILNMALKAQKKALIMAFIVFLSGAVTGCVTLEPGHYDHAGISTERTPYDRQYKKVRRYLETACRFKYKADAVGADYWQAPYETERLGMGDCEDKAIWLYSKLIKEGFDNIRLVLGDYEKSKSSTHMWVNWYHDGQVYILDPTINDGIWKTEEYSKKYYRPSYSYYKDKKWKHRT